MYEVCDKVSEFRKWIEVEGRTSAVEREIRWLLEDT